MYPIGVVVSPTQRPTRPLLLRPVPYYPRQNQHPLHPALSPKPLKQPHHNPTNRLTRHQNQALPLRSAPPQTSNQLLHRRIKLQELEEN